MRLDEKKQSRSFMKKNNSYSHCPLKKRPIHVLMSEEAPEVIKEEVTDVTMDDIPEPENLSTKPEDLSKSADRHYHHDQHQEQSKPEQKPENRTLKALSPIVKTSPSPSFATSPSSPPINDHPIPHVQHSLHQYQQDYHHYHTAKVITPPMAIPAIPVAKKGRVEVIQHNSAIAPVASIPTPLHFIASKTPLEPLNLNTPMEPLAHYAAPSWARANPLYPPNYLPYPPPAYRYPTAAAELYPSYPVPPYPHSPPDHHPSVSPPPHDALTCPTIQRPIARSYSYWASPDHCGLSPTSSVGSGPLRSPPPVTPEDLSSPGSESGRSSAGSTSAGGSMVVNTGNIKGEKTSSNSTTTSSSSTTTTSPRYQCSDCGKSYSTYSGLSKHQQFHCAAAQGQTKKSFSCKSCNKVYISLGALKMHIRTHTLPCKCHLCGKAFSRPWLLQGHIRTHTGEKPFSCQHCNRAFADRSNLRAHLQTHSDVKKYSCDSCSKTFSRMSLLTKHQEGGCPGVSVPIGYAC